MNSPLIKQIGSTIVLIGMLSSCNLESSYSGDGHLTDRGALAANERYLLDLGSIALDTAGTYRYRLERLPTENFVVGIEIKPSAEQRRPIEPRSVNPIVLLELTGPNQESVVRHQSTLDTWTWSVGAGDSTAFVYRREKPSTFFTPIANRSYELKVVVVQPDAGDSNYQARVLAKSGGWK